MYSAALKWRLLKFSARLGCNAWTLPALLLLLLVRAASVDQSRSLSLLPVGALTMQRGLFTDMPETCSSQMSPPWLQGQHVDACGALPESWLSTDTAALGKLCAVGSLLTPLLPPVLGPEFPQWAREKTSRTPGSAPGSLPILLQRSKHTQSMVDGQKLGS